MPARVLVAGSVLLAALCLAAPARAQTFSNPTPFTIHSSGAASLYPSEILVSGMPAAAPSVRVSIANLSHTWPADVDVLLVGPQGQNVILMSDAGSSSAITNVSFVFDDAAAESLGFGGPLLSGTYRPTNLSGTGSDLFVAPAPALSGATTLATFAGTNPNGLWSLYVLDDSAGDSGSIGSWSLTFAPEPATAAGPAAALALGALAFNRSGRSARRRPRARRR